MTDINFNIASFPPSAQSAIQPYVESLRVEASVMGALAEGGEA